MYSTSLTIRVIVNKGRKEHTIPGTMALPLLWRSRVVSVRI